MKIFFRVGELAKIEEACERKIGALIPVVQACARGYIVRKFYSSKNEKEEVAVYTLQRDIHTRLEFKNSP